MKFEFSFCSIDVMRCHAGHISQALSASLADRGGLEAVEIYDSRGVKLLTIPAVESVPKKPRWFQISMSRGHAMVLAKAICRLAKTGA